MTDRIAELRALIAAEKATHDACRTRNDVPLRERLAIRDDAADAMYAAMERDVPALLDCAEALRALLSYTKACEDLLNATPAGQVRMAEEALAKLNGDDHE